MATLRSQSYSSDLGGRILGIFWATGNLAKIEQITERR